MRSTCDRYFERAEALPDYPAPGGFWTATLEAIAHLCEAYCRADTDNMPRIIAALAAIIDSGRQRDRMDRYALDFIEFNMGNREQGGRGTELIEALAAYRK